MSLEDNKVLVRRFIDEILNAGNTAALTDFCIPGSMFARGLEGQIKAFRLSFPDNRFTIDEIIAEGDKVAVHAMMHGTNTGPLVGLPSLGTFETPVPPTGISVLWNRIYIFSVSDGKILNFTVESDQLGVLQQLGWTFTPPVKHRD
jgi:predicted ester cyclase